MPQPTPGQGHLDRFLSNVSLAFIQGADNFVATKAFPVIPVNFASDKYRTYDRGYFWRDEVGPRPLGGMVPVMGAKIGSDQYLCEEEGLAGLIDDRERANATPPYDPEQTKIIILTQNILIHQDREWADAFFKAGLWTHDMVGDASPTGDQFLFWDDPDGTPIQDMDAQRTRMMQATGMRPNVLVMGLQAFNTAKNNKDIVDRVKYTQRGVVTAELLASMFEVDRVVVASGVYNKAAEGATDDFDFIIDDNSMLLVHAAPNPGLMVPSAGYTFNWSGLLGGGGLTTPVQRMRLDREHSDWFEVRMAHDQKLVSPDLGIFFSGVHS